MKQLKLPLQLNWRCGPDMPFEMNVYIQSVVVQGRVYVGGGLAVGKHGIVMEYNTSSAKWAELPQYQANVFGMTAFNNQLVLVGGWDGDRYRKVLGVWGANSRKWTHPYPEMPTARSRCSAVVYEEWLIVAGGQSSAGMVSAVEVMNTDTKQWHIGQRTPTPWHGMKTAIVGDMCYFMGGHTIASSYRGTDSVYCVSLPALVSQALPQIGRENSHRAWKGIRGLGILLSAPLSINGSLLAVGGRDIAGKKDVTTIHLYQRDTGEWVKVGDLPTPRSSCTCAMIADSEILVAGGYPNGKLYLAHIIPS